MWHHPFFFDFLSFEAARMPSPWGQIITQAIFHPSALYTNVQVETAKSEMPMIEKDTICHQMNPFAPICER
jgi:hypothetical protein